jgi:hypothetical protein
MHTISREFFVETSLHVFTAEVSMLEHDKQLEGRNGLPRKFMIPGVGNGQSFVSTKIERVEGDLAYVEYEQIFGCLKAIIFND